MTRFSLRTVGFDLDGTLIDTSGDLAAAVNHVLAGEGRAPLTVEQVVAIVGGGTRRMLAEALAASGGGDAAAVDRLLPALLDFYEAHLAVHSRPYPHVVEVLDALTAAGVRLAVATNKVERLAAKLLEATGLRHRFATVIGGDTLGPGSEKPSGAMIAELVARCGAPAAFVGDSRFDVLAARAAGLPVVAVGFGYHRGAIGELGADAVIDDYRTLLPTLARLAPVA